MALVEWAGMKHCANCKQDGRCTRCAKRVPVARFPPFDDVDRQPKKTPTFSDNLELNVRRQW
jgi:ferredoxin